MHISGFILGPALAFLLSWLPSPSPDLTLDATSGYVIEAQVNGRPVRLRVDPTAPGYIVLNPAAVARIGLRRSLTRVRANVGPVRLTGSTKAANVSIAGSAGERRILWWDHEVVAGADGLISVADLPYGRVTMLLGEARADDKSFELPMEYTPSGGLFHRLRVGSQDFIVQVSVSRPVSVATAAAGALLTQLHGGTWAGAPRDERVSLGVMRPTRPLALERPFAVAGLPLARFLVRTQDHRGNAQLPAEVSEDPDEIVVTAVTGRQPPRYFLALGRDWLSKCSRLVWDNQTRILTMRCSPDAATG